MSIHNRLVGIIFILFAYISSVSAFGTVNFQHLSLKSMFSQITINGLYQDEYGVLWIGTKDGVKKYNGNNIESVNFLGINNWIQSNLVPTICGDKKGHLYINTDYSIIEYDLKNEESHVIFSQPNTQILPSIAFNYGVNSLWIGLLDSVYNYKEGICQAKYRINSDNMSISSLKETSGNILYIGTKHDGVFSISPAGKQEKVLTTQSEIISINEDSRNNIWIGTLNDGLFQLSPSGDIRQYTQPTLASNYVRTICEDNNGNIWIGTMLGLNVIDSRTGKIHFYGLEKDGKAGLSNLSVWIIMKDDQGTMWFGTYYGGLDYYNPHTDIFEYKNLKLGHAGIGPVVSKIIEDNTGRLWISTEGDGLVSYCPKTDTYEYYTKENNTISHNNVKTLYHDDASGMIWIGTHLGGLCSYSIDKKEFRHFTIDPTDHTKRAEIVQAIIRHKDILYLGTLSGIYYMNLEDFSIKKIEMLDKYIYAVNSLMIDSQENLWIGGNSLCYYSIKQNYVRSLDKYLAKTTASSKNTITSLIQDGNHRILASTLGAGILIYHTNHDTLEQVNSKNSNLDSDYLSAAYPLSDHQLLVTSANGLSYIDLNTKRSYNYKSQNGFVLPSMIPGDIMKSSSNHIIMGGINGLTMISESNLFPESLPTKMFFSKLFVNNKEVAANDSSQILNRALLATAHLKLKHRENNISIEIGTNDFVNLGQSKYQYKLDGYNDAWIEFHPQKSINYMNLPYGNYELKVRNISFKDETALNEISLGITIIPPIYATWYAFLLYTLLILSIISSIAYFYRSKLLLSNSLELERRDKIQKDAINESKMRFLGNISHELKTPIALISGQLELILLSSYSLPTIMHSLREVHNRAARMGALINELLDFLKYNKENFTLKVKKQDIIRFTQEIYNSFASYAELKNIHFNFLFEHKSQYIWFDEVQLQKVFNNILSNAFKFTPENGTVEIKITSSNSSVIITFTDSGIGIPEDMTGRIFERFFQVNNSVNRELSNTGTGIGLSLSLNITKAHHGQITVESEEGKGSSFIVELPFGNEHFKEDENVTLIEDSEEIEKVNDSPIILESDEDDLEDFIAQQKKDFDHSSTLLIVEDDDELRNLLIKIFEPIFKIYEAKNGEDAFKIAQLNSPDLILSDVMMPGISGINLCTRIKSHFDTSHIPVILLTALNSVEHNIKGLNCGADDYITKPFNIRILIAKCINLLNNRRKLQERYRKQENSTTEQLTDNKLDKDFIDQIINIVQTSLEAGNGDINVTLLCSELGLSRTKLFMKMKKITGESPHYFIQNIKLKTAARMLRENEEYNISDISFQLGFSSLNYFGKSFKEYFGMSPTSYRKFHQEKERSKCNKPE